MTHTELWLWLAGGMYWKQLEAFFFFFCSSYLVVATQGDTHRGKYTHSYLVKPPRARLLHNICPTFICPDAASQREMDEVEEVEEGREREEGNEEGNENEKRQGRGERAEKR